MVPSWLVPLALLAGSAATVITYGRLDSVRRTRYMITGYTAGVNAAKLPREVKVCHCGHPVQEHLEVIAPGAGCRGIIKIDAGAGDTKREHHLPCDCKEFREWYVDGEVGTCECGGRSFRDVTVCLNCGRWQ